MKNKLKQIVYGFRLNNVKKNLIKNAENIREAVKNNLPYKKFYNEQLCLMSCNSYLENKLSRISR